MRTLIIGSGGREHALVWKIAQSKSVEKIFCAPGNGGIAQLAECVDIKVEDLPGLLNFAKKEKIDFTIVGPEVPLSLGIVDKFKENNLKIFGPNKAASELEASKVFAKELMARHNIPTASFGVFTDIGEAKKYIAKIGPACVIKADGLAQGKGVLVAKSFDQANKAAESMLQDKIFGDAGNRIIIEECLEGEEASILIFTDGKDILPLASSQDHKRALDNDLGPNTGGMGAYSPAPIVTDELFKIIIDTIIKPTISGLAKEGIKYQGVLYAGIMLTKDGPKTLEYNVRFGDPETQAILPRLKSDLLEVMLAVSEGELARIKNLDWDSRACVCVVCASGGYPGNYNNGKEIFGLEQAAKINNVVIFHAGTKIKSTENRAPRTGLRYLTNGGRVLGVTALGDSIKEAIDKTYQAVEKINFERMHYRRDIGKKAMTIDVVSVKLKAKNVKPKCKI